MCEGLSETSRRRFGRVAPVLVGLLFGAGALGAASLTEMGLTLEEPRDGGCYRTWKDGGRIDDGCSFRLLIELTTTEGVGSMLSVADVSELVRRAQAYEDAGVSIEIPKASWGPPGGGGGSYSGVLIKAGGGYVSWHKAGCERPGPDQPAGYTGSVHFAELSPERIEGSYSATLYRRAVKISPGRFQCEARTVSGRFFMPLPVRFDARMPADPTPRQTFRAALNVIAPLAPALGATGPGDPSGRRGGSDRPGGGVGRTGGGADCDCSCAAKAEGRWTQSGRDCRPVCRPFWDGECPDEAPPSTTESGTGTEEDYMERLVELIMKQQPNESARPMIEQMVRDMTPEQRREMIEILGSVPP